jgi:malate dehydrogenase
VRLVVILGAGELGGALARHLAAADVVSRIVLVDEAGQIASGKALDIRQAAPIDAYSTLVEGTTDESVVVAADVVVVADHASGGAASDAEWQGDSGVALLGRAAHLNRRAMLLCAGGRQLDLIERGVRDTGIAQNRLLGSAPEALRAAVVSMMALEAGCSPAEISLTVVGRPPAQIIVPWDDAAIGGRRATEVLSAPAIARLDGRLSRLWPPGPLTLASAATRVISAAVTRARSSMSAFVAVSRDGDRGRVAMLPVTMTQGGVAQVLSPTMSARDRVRLETVFSR